MEKVILKKIHTTIKPTDYPEEPIGKIISTDTMAFDEEGNFLLYYCKCPKNIYNYAKYISLNTKPSKSARTRHGLPQLSTVYGPLPRIPIREDYCRFSKKTSEEAENAKKAFRLNELLSEFYKKNLERYHAQALKKVEQEVLKDYRVVNTPWTNININLNQVIKYHYDAGNNSEDLSNVIIVKKGVDGGMLACPEYGITLKQENGYMVFFKGQEILHGVTPCVFKNEKSFRSSIVHYTLKGLRNCYPYEKELIRLKEVKTRQALNRIENNKKLKAYYEKMVNKK